MQKKQIVFYDSMGGGGTQVLEGLKRYIADESLDKKKQELDLSKWTIRSARNIPQQANSYDCGVFTCTFADFISDDLQLNFTQSDVEDWRSKIGYATLQGRIRYGDDPVD